MQFDIVNRVRKENGAKPLSKKEFEERTQTLGEAGEPEAAAPKKASKKKK